VVNWNAPADYNLTTGLVDINAASTNGLNNNLSKTQPQSSVAYTAQTIKSTFSHGRFEQELHGTVLTNLNKKDLANAAANGRASDTNNTGTTTAGGSREATLDANGNVTDESIADPNKWGSEPDTPQPTSTDSNPNIVNAPTQSASPAGAPTSNGDIAAIQSVQANYNTQNGGFTAPADAVAAANGQATPLTNEQQAIQQMAHRDD
jgi:hypothetical protein